MSDLFWVIQGLQFSSISLMTTKLFKLTELGNGKKDSLSHEKSVGLTYQNPLLYQEKYLRKSVVTQQCMGRLNISQDNNTIYNPKAQSHGESQFLNFMVTLSSTQAYIYVGMKLHLKQKTHSLLDLVAWFGASILEVVGAIILLPFTQLTVFLWSLIIRQCESNPSYGEMVACLFAASTSHLPVALWLCLAV